MDFRIANTFTDSLAKLTGVEQKAAKTTAFDLQTESSPTRAAIPQVGEDQGPELLVCARQ